MKRIKGKAKYVVLLILIFLIILMLFNLLNNNRIVNSIYTQFIKQLSETEESIISYAVYDNQNNNNVRVLFTVSNIGGIEYIEKPDGTKISVNGKASVSFDNGVILNSPVVIKVKRMGNPEIEEFSKTISQEYIDSLVDFEQTQMTTEYVKVKVIDNSKIKFNSIQYMLNNSGTYTNATDTITINSSILTGSGPWEINIKLKKTDKAGNIICIDKKYTLERFLRKLNPIMTSNTSPSGVASGKSGDSGDMSSKPYYAFDGKTGSSYNINGSSGTSNAMNGWIQYQFAERRKVTQIRMYPRNPMYNYNLPKTFSLQGSDDGVNFTTIQSYTNTSYNIQWYTYDVQNENEYLYYRITGTAFSDRLSFAEIEFIGY